MASESSAVAPELKSEKAEVEEEKEEEAKSEEQRAEEESQEDEEDSLEGLLGTEEEVAWVVDYRCFHYKKMYDWVEGLDVICSD